MRILLVDDEQEGRSFLAEYLMLLGHSVVECDAAEAALTIYEQQAFDLVLSDIKMGGMSGLELVKEIRRHTRQPQAAVVLYTGFVDVGLVVGALRAGAFDYLMKPINVQELKDVLKRVSEQRPATEQQLPVAAPARSVAQQPGVGKVGIFSAAMQQIVRQARQYHTDRSLPILIQGETGVGKDIVARMIHYGDGEATGPFIALNCAAITPSLFESELFGYEGGAFTGAATRGSRGKLDMAMGGTLFLDEVAEIPVELQAKLLRVIEERSFYRVGGLKPIATDLRIICATNLDFAERIAAGLFRKDLYYRLKVGQLLIPPLRERTEDILPLAELFLKEFAERRGKTFCQIEAEAAAWLTAYSWPGNVRELRNAMEWVTFMYDDLALRADHLQALGLPPPAAEIAAPAAQPLNAHVDQLVLDALARHQGNKTRAARELGISVRALYYRLERMGHSLQ